MKMNKRENRDERNERDNRGGKRLIYTSVRPMLTHSLRKISKSRSGKEKIKVTCKRKSIWY